MKTLVMSAAIAAAIVMPSMLLAADGSAPKPMFVCHAAAASDTPNATMGSTGLMCSKVDGAKMKATLTKVHAMEDKMDAPTRAEVEQLERMITQGMYGG
jgi:folate-binding Fe-S cluster repair protein YgfZ